MNPRLAIALLVLLAGIASEGAETNRHSRFRANTPDEAVAWQRSAREKLFALMMGGQEPARCALDAKVLRRVEVPGERLCVGGTHAADAAGPPGSRLAGAAHAAEGQGGGGAGASTATAAAARRSCAGAASTGMAARWPRWATWSSRRMWASTNLQHTNWSLMGERTWDALRCLDYVVTLAGSGSESPGGGRPVAGRRNHDVCGRAG